MSGAVCEKCSRTYTEYAPESMIGAAPRLCPRCVKKLEATGRPLSVKSTPAGLGYTKTVEADVGELDLDGAFTDPYRTIKKHERIEILCQRRKKLIEEFFQVTVELRQLTGEKLGWWARRRVLRAWAVLDRYQPARKYQQRGFDVELMPMLRELAGVVAQYNGTRGRPDADKDELYRRIGTLTQSIAEDGEALAKATAPNTNVFIGAEKGGKDGVVSRVASKGNGSTVTAAVADRSGVTTKTSPHWRPYDEPVK
jgi:hypothetical protein